LSKEQAIAKSFIVILSQSGFYTQRMNQYPYSQLIGF